jgi:hypothetical protein
MNDDKKKEYCPCEGCRVPCVAPCSRLEMWCRENNVKVSTIYN